MLRTTLRQRAVNSGNDVKDPPVLLIVTLGISGESFPGRTCVGVPALRNMLSKVKRSKADGLLSCLCGLCAGSLTGHNKTGSVELSASFDMALCSSPLCTLNKVGFLTLRSCQAQRIRTIREVAIHTFDCSSLSTRI